MNTPRTDAENYRNRPGAFPIAIRDVVDAKFARTLETELAEMTAQRDEWSKKYYDVADAVCRESTGVEDLCRQARQLRADLAEMTAERDALKGEFQRGFIQGQRAERTIWLKVHEVMSQ